MKRLLFLAYAAICYAVFFVAFLYAVGFVSNAVVPTTLDASPSAPLGTALLIDALLLGVFAVQHSVMARAGFKRWWTRIIPTPVERSTYVLAASLALLLLFWQWRPIGGALWDVHGAARTALIAISLAGWGLVFVGTFVIDHFELFGLRQAWTYFRGRDMPAPKLSEAGPYKVVRHPLYLGFTIAFWSTPRMTLGHLVFAGATLAYVLIAIRLEERDLVRVFGDAYRAYRRRVPMLAPLPLAAEKEDGR